VDIANQLEQVGVFLTEYGFIAVLKKMPSTAIPPIEVENVPGQ
jgi:hypothetical protein